MIRIDSHHHLWQYNTEDYGWIPDEMAVLRRDFLPEDLKVEIDKANIDKVITVQARQCLKETDWLLSLADKYSFICAAGEKAINASCDASSIIKELSKIFDFLSTFFSKINQEQNFERSALFLKAI